MVAFEIRVSHQNVLSMPHRINVNHQKMMVVAIKIGYKTVAEVMEMIHTSQLKISSQESYPIFVKLLYGTVPVVIYVDVVAEIIRAMRKNAISGYHIRIQGSHHGARFRFGPSILNPGLPSFLRELPE